MRPILEIDQIPPTLDAAEQIVKCWLSDHPDFKWQGDTDRPLSHIFSSPEAYADAVIPQALGYPAEDDKVTGTDGHVYAVEAYSGLTIWSDGDDPEETAEIEVTSNMLSGLSPRSLTDVNVRVVRHCIESYEEMGENWLEEEGYPAWFDLISLRTEEIAKITAELNTIMFGSFREFMELLDFRNSKMSEDLHIPLRTIEEWKSGKNSCKLYMRLLIAQAKGLFRYT